MEETFRLDLNQPWEAIDIKTGHAVLIPKGSHQAIRMLLKSPPDQTEENYLVVTVQHEGKRVLAGLREAYWRQWEGHYIPELRVTIRGMNEKPHPPVRRQLLFPPRSFNCRRSLFIADTINERIRKVSSNGIITTVAGNGSSGYSGDRGPAINAQLYSPYAVAVDSAGNLFIVDGLRIRQVSSNGIITTVAGNGSPGYSGDGGPAIKAQLNHPQGLAGVAVDGLWILFIAWSNRISTVV